MSVPTSPLWPILPTWVTRSAPAAAVPTLLAADLMTGIVHGYQLPPGPAVPLPGEFLSPIAAFGAQAVPVALAGNGTGTVFIYCAGSGTLYSLDYPARPQSIGPYGGQEQFNANGIAFAQGQIFGLGDNGGIFQLVPNAPEVFIAAVPAPENTIQGMAADATNGYLYALSGTTLHVLTLAGQSVTSIDLPIIFDLPAITFFAAISLEPSTGSLGVLYWRDENTPKIANVAGLPYLAAQIASGGAIEGVKALSPRNFWSAGAIAGASPNGNLTAYVSARLSDTSCEILSIDTTNKTSSVFVSASAELQNVGALAVCDTAATLNWTVLEPGRLPDGQPLG